MSTTVMTTLEAARDAMALIAGVASCKIGLESNISPADYPLIRVVPSRLTPGKPYGNRTMIETLIYFGAQTAKSEGWKRCTATCSTWNPPSSRPCRAWAGATGRRSRTRIAWTPTNS